VMYLFCAGIHCLVSRPLRGGFALVRRSYFAYFQISWKFFILSYVKTGPSLQA
jgi:hypothetical protein